MDAKRMRYNVKMGPKFLRKGMQFELHGQRITIPEDGWYCVEADVVAELPPSAKPKEEPQLDNWGRPL